MLKYILVLVAKFKMKSVDQAYRKFAWFEKSAFLDSIYK